MPIFVIFLILFSTIFHTAWNFLVKKSKDKDIFLMLSFLVGGAYFLIPSFIYFFYYPFPVYGWLFIFGSGFVNALYFIFLSRAYTNGDLSITYPIIRSSSIFVPIIAWITIGEKISLWGGVGILVIISGVYILNVDVKSFKKTIKNIATKSIFFAFFAAFFSALYSVIDKSAVSIINPLLYNALYTFLATPIFISIYILLKKKKEQILEEWHLNKKLILLVPILIYIAYSFILFAFQFGKVSYIVSIRQFSIVLGVFLGVKHLKEGFLARKLIGSLFIVAGIIILSIVK